MQNVWWIVISSITTSALTFFAGQLSERFTTRRRMRMEFFKAAVDEFYNPCLTYLRTMTSSGSGEFSIDELYNQLLDHLLAGRSYMSSGFIRAVTDFSRLKPEEILHNPNLMDGVYHHLLTGREVLIRKIGIQLPEQEIDELTRKLQSMSR